MRRATDFRCAIKRPIANFYPRSPCGERHNINSSVNTADQISIHALLAESDVYIMTTIICTASFLSTLSLRRATRLGLLGWLRTLISIHALLAESDSYVISVMICTLLFLSTLSLRRATYLVRGQHPSWGISIHALLAESDACTTTIIICTVSFLSTLSLRRATPV